MALPDPPCPESGTTRAWSSRNAFRSSSNVTPCLVRLARFFLASHSKVSSTITTVQWPKPGRQARIPTAHAGAAQDMRRYAAIPFPKGNTSKKCRIWRSEPQGAGRRSVWGKERLARGSTRRVRGYHHAAVFDASRLRWAGACSRRRWLSQIALAAAGISQTPPRRLLRRRAYSTGLSLLGRRPPFVAALVARQGAPDMQHLGHSADRADDARQVPAVPDLDLQRD